MTKLKNDLSYVSLLLFTVKIPRPCESRDGSSQLSRGESDLATNWMGCHKTSATKRRGPLSHLETRFQTPVPTNPISETSEAVCADQDQPLSFDRTRLAVATAAFRGPSDQRGISQTQSLSRVLQSGLPNLNNALLGQTFSTQNRDTVGPTESNEGATMGSDVRQKDVFQEHESDCEAAERIPGKSSSTGATGEKTCHVLGLDCYSSSDEECDT